MDTLPTNIEEIGSDVWDRVEEDLATAVRNGKLPAFYKDNIWKMVRFNRHRVILRSLYKENIKQCLTTSYRYITTLAEVFEDMTDEYNARAKRIKDETVDFKLDSFNTESGLVFTFWVFQQADTFDTKKTVLEGYANNKKIYEYSINKTGNTNLSNKFILAGEEVNVPSTSTCAENIFIMLIFQRDCDAYSLKVVMRSLGKNSRWSFDKKLTPEQVENVKFVFKDVTVANMYGDFIYKPTREQSLMAAGTSIAKQKELLANAGVCTDDMFTSCLYMTINGCLQCSEPGLQYNGQCVPTCPDGTFKQDGVCKACHASCSKCTSKDNGTCLSCTAPFVLDDGYCKEACSLNKYVINGLCKQCNAFCLECSDEANCNKCDAIHFVMNGQCVDECETGYYKTLNPNECKSCDKRCTKCSSQTLCDGCQDGYLLKDGICQQSCGMGFYAERIMKKCFKCIDNCKECIDGDSCNTCLEGYTMSDGKCITECPEGTIPIKGVCAKCVDQSCKRCNPDNISECKICNEQSVLLNGQCVTTCGKFFFENNRQCIPCPENCETCNLEKCFECSETKVLLEDRECRSNCPDGYVQKGRVCVKCTNPLECKTCNPDSLDQCTECYDPFLLQVGKCLTTCDEAHFAKPPVCENCLKNCLKCKNQYTCDECKPGFVRKGNECVAECGTGYILIDNTCHPCQVTDCELCTSLEICTKCSSDSFLYNNMCQAMCPEMTYGTPDFKCENCGPNCEQCEDSKTCTLCNPRMVLQGTQCQKTCEFGYENIGGVCTQCSNPRCEKCVGAVCTSCPLGNLLHQGDCVTQCPSGYYVEANTCLPCNQLCNTCDGLDACIDCTAGFTLFQSKCIDNCPNGTINLNNVCEPCTASRCAKCKDTLSECIDCEVGLFLLNGKCYNKCPDGYFGINGQCFPCLDGCKQCASADICLTCFEDKVLKEGSSCVSHCEDGYVETIIDDIKICKKCTSNCKECSAIDTNQCTKCPAPLVKYKGECRFSCPDGTIAIQGETDTECISCRVNDCRKCPTLDTCELCLGDLFLTGSTICSGTSCQDGYTKDNERPICNRCEVSQCKHCPSLNTKICEECDTNMFLYKEDTCLQDCPALFYKNRVTMRCEACPLHCIDCANNNECNKCESNYFLLNKRCEKECPSGYTAVEGSCVRCQVDQCSECLKGDPRYCNKCTEPYVLTNPYSLANLCENTCPNGFYPDAFGTCEKCITDCDICENSSTCKRCIEGKLLTHELKCTDKCPRGTISVNDTCMKCLTVDSNCIKCSDVELSSCTMCSGQMKLLDNKCIIQCPEGYFEDQGECKKCIPGCQKCSNGKTCDLCQPSWVQFENKCHRQCPSGYYEDNRLCMRCIDDCEQCSSATCDICSKDPKFYNQDGKCVPKCDTGYYLQNLDECARCEANCIQCNGISDCQICEPGYFKVNGKCIATCERGFFVKDNECRRCSIGCRDCGLDTCKECEEPYLLYKGQCREVCPTGSYKTLEKNECESCKPNCMSCSSCDACDKCQDPLLLSHDRLACVESCESGYIAVNGICTKCSVENCRSCHTSVSTCDDCIVPFKLNGNECQHTCPKGTYDDNGRCRQCQSQCASCESASICTSCIENFFLLNNECKNKCMNGYVAINQKCDRCNTLFCKVCDTDRSTCLSCDEDKVLFTKTNDDNTVTTECREICGDYYFKNAYNKCEKCTSSCLDCSESKCRKCGDGKVLNDNQCVERCPDGFVERNGECFQCNTVNCSICDNVTLQTCNVCKNGFALKDGTCHADCPSGTYRFTSDRTDECRACKDNCRECKNANSCEKCIEKFYLKNNSCVVDCGNNFVLLDNGMCEKCADPNCRVCEKDTTTCISCNNPYFLQTDGLCTPSCVERYYNDKLDYTCRKCSDKFCLECSPHDTCTKCESTMVLLNGKCREFCPAGYVTINRNDVNICEKCTDSDCSKCLAPGPKQCQECFSLKVFGRECVDRCPNGTYDIENKYCRDCNNPLCKVCFDETKCDTCINGYIRDDDFMCKDSCPSGTVEKGGKCVKCLQNGCAKCDKTNLSVCLDCSPFFDLNGECVETCPTGTYSDGFKCRKCRSNCDTCLNNSSCLTCKAPMVLQGDKCQAQCSPGFVYDSNVKMCKKCSDPAKCETCLFNNLDICLKCQNGFILDGAQCYDNCPANKWNINNTECKECASNCAVCKSANECKTCITPFVLLNGKCSSQCPENYGNDLGVCRQCGNPRCRECDLSNPKQCISCPEDYWLHKGDCVNSCPLGTYFLDDMCVDCDPTCENCKGQFCKKCKPGYVKDKNNLCKSPCPDGTVSRGDQCVACADSKCKQCAANNLNECFDCKESFLFNKLCQVTCPEGYHADPKSKKCVQCQTNCKRCDQTGCLECMNDFYFMEGTKSCINCREPFTIIPPGVCSSCRVEGCLQCITGKSDVCSTCQVGFTKFNDKCIRECPVNMYKSGTECKSCSSNCLKCDNDNTCSTCEPGYINFNKFCVKECPNGWISNTDGVCIKCNQDDCDKCDLKNLEFCHKCKEGVVKYKDRCEKTCPNGTYKNGNICLPCDGKCEICENIADKCLKCKPTYRKLGEDCLPKCPQGYLDDGVNCQQCADSNCLSCDPLNICLKCGGKTFLDKTKQACFSNCPENTYADPVSRECRSCSLGCQICDAEKCLNCKDNLYLQNGKCQNPCENKFTNVNGICQPCQDSHCNVCSPEDPSKCTDCRPGFVYNHKCIPKCPAGTFPEGGKCIDCEKSCLECTSLTECQRCKNEFILSNGLCTNSCPDGKVTLNGTCVSCADTRCKQCLTETTKCVECNSPFYLVGDKCSDNCINGFYAESGKCSKCPDSCVSCSGLTQCISCQSGYFLANNQCKRECKVGEYPDCKTNTCLQCSPACETCFDETPDSCIKCARGFFKSDKTCVSSTNCKPGYYPDINIGSCVACKISMCQDCEDDKTCRTCLRGFQLSNGKCIISATSQNVFTSSQIFSSYVYKKESSRTTYNFNSQLKGIAVGSNIVSVSFWLKKLKASNTSSNIFSIMTSTSSVALNLSTKVVNNKQICEVTYTTSNGTPVALSTIDCSYDALEDWTFFLINYSKKRDNTGILRVIVTREGGRLEEFLTEIPLDLSNLVQKETILQFFNNIESQDAFEITNFNVMDYYPSETDLNKYAERKPDECDYMCADCRGKCYRCSNGQLLDDNTCPAAYIPVKTMNTNLSTDTVISLREKLTKKNFSTKRFAISFWLYLTNLDTDYNLFGMYYDTMKSTTDNNSLILNVTIVNKRIVLNSSFSFGHKQIEINKWYMVSISVRESWSALHLRDMAGTMKFYQENTFGLRLPKITDDLVFILGNSYGVTQKAHIQGNIYDFRFYINNYPSAEDVDQFALSVKCPENCKTCNQDFSCEVCNDGFKIGTDFKCVDVSLETSTILLEKMSLWNKDSVDLNISESVKKNKFAISFWLRKKRHSIVTTPDSHSLFSVLGGNGKKYTILRQYIKANYISEYSYQWLESSSETKFTHDHSNEISEYMHIVFNFDFVANSLEINIKDGATIITKSASWNIDFSKIVIGDSMGSQVNMEIAMVTYYPQWLSQDNITKLRGTPPKDCDPGCITCDYKTGICKKCIQKTANVEKCMALFKGFSSVAYFEKKSYNDPINVEAYTVDISKDFKTDVNSLAYTMVGYFRLLDLPQYLKKDGNYVIATVTNFNKGPIDVPGAVLIGIEVRVANSQATLVWVLNDPNNIKVVPFDPQPKLDKQSWILIMGSISVKDKTLTYKYRSGDTTTGPTVITLDNYPERLVETSYLKMFGFGRTLTTDYVQGNGNFHEFYLTPNAGYNEKMFDYFVSKTPPRDLECTTGCTKCFTIDEEPLCVECQAGFTLNDYKCTPPISVGYVVLNDKWSDLTKGATFDIAKFNYPALKSWAIGFYFRRNYLRSSDAKQLFMKLGNLRIYTLIELGNYNFAFELEGSSGTYNVGPIDKDKSADYKWYAVTISINNEKSKIQVIIMDLSKKIIANTTLPVTAKVTHDNKLTVSTNNFEFQIYNLHVANKSIEFPIVEKPSKDCDFDCDACNDGKCLSCSYGYNKDGSCKAMTLNLNTRLINNKNFAIESVLKLGDYLGKTKPLRSNRFTLVFSFDFNVNVDSFRVLRLTNTGEDIEPSNQVSNFLTLTYIKSQKKFVIRVTNRFVGGTIKLIEQEAVYPLSTDTNLHYVAIGYDGASKKVTLYAANSKTNNISKEFTFEGSSEYMTNFTNIYLSNVMNKASNDDFIKYRDWKLYYTQGLTSVGLLTQLVNSYIKDFQAACTVSARNQCLSCSTKSKNGVCTPTSEVQVLFRNEVKQYNYDYSKRAEKFQELGSDKFTLSFWWRRLSFSDYSYGIAKLTYVNSNKKDIPYLDVFYETGNLIVTGRVGTVNTVVVPEVYGEKDQLDWLHITIAYDILKNNLYVYVVNENGKTNTKENPLNATNNGANVIGLTGIQNYYYIIAYDNTDFPAVLCNFELSVISFTPGAAFTSRDAEQFRIRKPRECMDACNVDCIEEMCPPSKRITSEFILNNLFALDRGVSKTDDIETINKLFQFRPLKQLTSSEADTAYYSNFIVSFELNVANYFSSKYTSNKNILLSLSNNNTKQVIESKTMGDLIDASQYKYGVVSLVVEDNNLVVYTATNKPTDQPYFVKLALVKGLNSYNNLYFSMYVDYKSKLARAYVYVDDLAFTFDTDSENPTQFITMATLVYNHPATTNFKLNVHNPRFDIDFEKNYYSRPIFTDTNPATQSCQSVENNCNKCITVKGIDSNACLRCNAGFVILDNATCFASSNK
jgi:hypothetical protein